MVINNVKLRLLDGIRDRYKGYDDSHIVNIIMEIEKKNKTGVSNKWIDDRWYELKMKSRRELEDILVKYKIPEIDKLTSDEIRNINNLLDVYNLIRASLFEGIKEDEIDIHKFSEHFIEILKNQNEKIDEITENIIQKINEEFNSTLFKILKYVINVHQFYYDELKERFAIYCNISNLDEFHCFRAEIIPNEDIKIIEKYGDPDKFIEVNGKFFNQEEMKFLFEIDLKKYIDWNELAKKAIENIKQKFPKGTIIVMDT